MNDVARFVQNVLFVDVDNFTQSEVVEFVGKFADFGVLEVCENARHAVFAQNVHEFDVVEFILKVSGRQLGKRQRTQSVHNAVAFVDTDVNFVYVFRDDSRFAAFQRSQAIGDFAAFVRAFADDEIVGHKFRGTAFDVFAEVFFLPLVKRFVMFAVRRIEAGCHVKRKLADFGRRTVFESVAVFDDFVRRGGGL